MFDQVETSDFSKGTFALHGLQKVEIIGVNLPEKTRQVSWVEFGEDGETKRWVSVDALKPLPKPFTPKVVPPVAVIDSAVIADLEAQPSGVLDIPALVERVVNGGVAADAAAETIAPLWEIDDVGTIAATGERVQIVGTDLFSQRKVAYLDLEGVDSHWLDIRELKPITAVLEMDLAKQRDELQAQLKQKDALIEGLREETAKMSDQIDTLTADYDTKFKAQLDLNNKMKRDLDAETEKLSKAALRISELRSDQLLRSKSLDADDYDQLEHLIMHSNAELLDRIKALESAKQQPQRRKIETMIMRDPEMHDLALKINEGWDVVFETVYVSQSENGWGVMLTESTHLIRLQREVKEDVAPSPLETHVALDIPVSEGEPLEEVIVPDARQIWEEALRSDEDGDNHPDHNYDDDDVEVPDLVHQEPVLMRPSSTAFIRPDGLVQKGRLVVDPKANPYTATLMMGVTTDELIATLDDQIKQKVMHVLAGQPQRSAPVPLLLGQPQAQP